MGILEQDIDKLYRRLMEIEKRGLLYSGFRRFLAYLLKIVVIGSGLAVGSGSFKPYDPVLGFAAAGALALDSVFSNLKRLVAEVAAGYAAKDQNLRITSNHHREVGLLQELLKQKRITEADFHVKRVDLETITHKALEEAVAKIEDGIRQSDIEALKALALDSKDKI